MNQKRVLILAMVFTGLAAVLVGSPVSWAAPKGTNMTVDTSELGPISINDKVKTKQEKPSLKIDENVALGLDDDGNPNVGMRF